MGIALFLWGLILGGVIVHLYHETRLTAQKEIAHYYDPKLPKLRGKLNDLLKQSATEMKIGLRYKYNHLDDNMAEVFIDRDMHDIFLEMVDDLEQSIKTIRTKQSAQS